MVDELGLQSTGIAEIVILDASRDGIRQITDFLNANRDIAAVHILSHGSSGSLALGNTQLSANTLGDYADDLASWHAALVDGADILLYGCNVADGEWGIAFVQDLALLTGADVAASEDLTGAADLGGDWVLEVQYGVIEAEPFALSFAGVLATNVDGTAAADTFIVRKSNVTLAGTATDAGSSAATQTARVSQRRSVQVQGAVGCNIRGGRRRRHG